jgi:hypothetical protein
MIRTTMFVQVITVWRFLRKCVFGGVQIWKVAGNVLNKHQQTSDKGCAPV